MPRPWFPLYGLVTTGKPMRPAARTAWPSLCTSSCFGTGNPSDARILLVSSLSLASSTAMCGVRLETVAWMRC